MMFGRRTAPAGAFGKPALVGALAWAVLAAGCATPKPAADAARNEPQHEIQSETQGAAQQALKDTPPDAADGAFTRQEKIAELDKALLKSINRGALSGEEHDAAANPAGREGVAESAPASDIQGDLSAGEGAKKGAASDAATDAIEDIAGIDQPPALPGGGATLRTSPQDIPSGDNDDVIAQELRQAAVEETDPIQQAKLWNEYRRYQGLPVKALPEI